MNAKVKDLKSKEVNTKRMVPIESYNKLKTHLHLLLKKHQSFRDMILTSGENFDPNNFIVQQQLKSLANFNSFVPPLNIEVNQKPQASLLKESDFIDSDNPNKVQLQLVFNYFIVLLRKFLN